jgi:hypothetical protein
MKKIVLMVLCAAMSLLAAAQNTRMVQGVVFNEVDVPMEGVTLSTVGLPASCVTGENGTFQFYVSPYAKNVQASMEGYISQTAEIDGSYLVFKLKVDREYVRRKAQAEAAARLAAEQEAAAKAKAEEEARLAAERKAAAEAKAAEEARIAAEKKAAAEAKAAEEARIAAEKKAAAEAKAAAKAEEKARLAAEKAADSKKAKPEKSAKPKKVTPKRYFSYLSGGVPMAWDSGSFAISYTGGGFNKKGNLFLGGGVDVTSAIFDQEEEVFQVGVYGNGKYFFSTKRIRPFVSLSLGASLNQQVYFWHGEVDHIDEYVGLYVKPELGLLVNIHNNLGIYASCDLRTTLGDEPFLCVNLGLTF